MYPILWFAAQRAFVGALLRSHPDTSPFPLDSIVVWTFKGNLFSSATSYETPHCRFVLFPFDPSLVLSCVFVVNGRLALPRE